MHHGYLPEIDRSLGLYGEGAQRFWSDFHVLPFRRRLLLLERRMESADLAAGARVPVIAIPSPLGNLVVFQAADFAEAARLAMQALLDL